MSRLGVNIDHIATLRQARRIDYPDPCESLPILVKCGVDQVTCHLREDRRHIQDADLKKIISVNLLPVNMELAVLEEMVGIALKLKPHTCTFVPEKREEITTEGGLDVVKNSNRLKEILPKLKEKGIRLSLFIDPDLKQIDASVKLNVEGVEFHTGTYCEAFSTSSEKTEFSRLKKACTYAKQKGLQVYAGHGLNHKNLPQITTIKEIEEYNIGHSIIARSIFLGLEKAVKEIQDIIHKN